MIVNTLAQVRVLHTRGVSMIEFTDSSRFLHTKMLYFASQS